MIRARDQQQGLRELRESVDLLGRPPQRVSQLALALTVPQGKLELGAQQCERRAQLVARIRDEGALAQERRLEAGEHLVERLSQPLDLVAGLRHRQALAGPLRRDDGGAASHRLHRPQREPGQGVARERGQDQRDRPGDQ